MTRKMGVGLGTILLCGLMVNAASEEKNNAARYLMKGDVSVRISVETGRQRDGLTPVRVHMQRIRLELWMDNQGRVFDEAMMEAGMDEKSMAARPGLFSLDKTIGRMQSGGQILNGQVVEQNALRTRLRFNKLAVALRLDPLKGRAALELNGIVIPVRTWLGKETGGVQELKFGEGDGGDEGRLFLDAAQGLLLYEDSRSSSATNKRQASRVLGRKAITRSQDHESN